MHIVVSECVHNFVLLCAVIIRGPFGNAFITLVEVYIHFGPTTLRHDAELSARHFGTGSEVSGHFGTTL